MSICQCCGLFFHHLGLASHRAACRRRKKNGGLTPKQMVLKRYPNAISWSWANCVEIFDERYNSPPHGNKSLGRGATAQIAWDEAARKLK